MVRPTDEALFDLGAVVRHAPLDPNSAMQLCTVREGGGGAGEARGKPDTARRKTPEGL